MKTDKASRIRSCYGPWALVTGASSGIGKAFAEALAVQGVSLVLVARGEARLNALAQQLKAKNGIETRCLVVDLSVGDAAQIIAQQVADLEIGLLVNNAGITTVGTFLKDDLNTMTQAVQVNVTTPMQLTYLLGRKMSARKRGGIIFVASTAGHQPFPYQAHYAATKAYLKNLGETLSLELEESGVDIVVVSPGPTETEGMRNTPGLDISRMPAGSVQPIPAEQVASATLTALGKHDLIIPTFKETLITALGQRVFPRKFLPRIYGKYFKMAIDADRL